MESSKMDVETLSDIQYALCVQEKQTLAEKEKKTYRFHAVSGKIFASVVARFDVPGMRKNMLTLYSSAGEKAVSVEAEAMSIFAYDGKTRKKLCECRADTWFSIRVALDTDTRLYQVFVDGVRFLDHAAFAEDAGDIAAFEASTRMGTLVEKQIFVYRNPVQSVVEAAHGKKIYNARELQIEADGTTDVTEKLQTLIDQCAAEGGGVLYLQGGTYVSGMLVFQQGTQLYLETDATLKGSLDIHAYPSRNNPNWNMAHFGPQRALIYAENIEGFVIEGGGTIDGSGHFPGDYGSENERPSAILLFHCHHSAIRDVYVKDAGMWTMPMVDCSDLYLRDINLFSCWFPNRDGVDLCDTRDVLIENCSFMSDDDTVCFKSGGETGCSHILVRNMMIISAMANAVKFGTGSYGKFAHCTVTDCTVKDTRLGAVCVESVDGAKIEALHFKNLDIQNVGAAFLVVLGDRGSIPPSAVRRVGAIDGVRFQNILVEGINTDYGCYISGLEKDGAIYKVKHIVFDHVSACFQGGVSEAPKMPPEYDGRYPETDMFRELPASCYFIRHAEDVAFEDCDTRVLRADVRDKIVAVDAEVHDHRVVR